MSEDYDGEWGEIPLTYSKGSMTATDALSSLFGVSMAIQKAQNNHDDEIVPVLKQIKRYLQKLGQDSDKEA